MWKISNYNVPPGADHWQVREVEFYSDNDCVTRVIPNYVATDNWFDDGEAVTPDPRPDRVLDGDLTTEWESFAINPGFGQGADADPAWLAFVFDVPTVIKCFKMVQGPRKGVPTYSLWNWEGTSFSRNPVWLGYSLFGAEEFIPLFDPDTLDFNQRPHLENSLWAVANAEQITSYTWAVEEIQFFSDEFCEVQLVGVQPIADSWIGNKDPSFAFDGGSGDDVSWLSGCRQTVEGERGCDRLTSWIGSDFVLNRLLFGV